MQRPANSYDTSKNLRKKTCSTSCIAQRLGSPQHEWMILHTRCKHRSEVPQSAGDII